MADVSVKFLLDPRGAQVTVNDGTPCVGVVTVHLAPEPGERFGSILVRAIRRRRIHTMDTIPGRFGAPAEVHLVQITAVGKVVFGCQLTII